MNGQFTVVLLPGLDGTGRLFRRFVDQIQSPYKPVVISYPGDRELDYTQLEGVIRAQLPVNAPYIIVGESFSGPLAVAFAARPAGSLRGIVMVASFVTPPARGLWRYLPWRTVFRFPTPALVLRRVAMNADPEMINDMREAVREVSPQVLASRLRLVLEVDVRNDLAQSTIPLLYVQAKRDLLVPDRCLKAISQQRDNVTVECVDSAHYVLQLAPEAAWQAIGSFARRIHAN